VESKQGRGSLGGWLDPPVKEAQEEKKKAIPIKGKGGFSQENCWIQKGKRGLRC